MKKRLPTNVRVVKCPKCSKLLPEPTDVPFYICGGCSTYLQAKYYKKENIRKPDVSDDSSNVLPQNNHQGGGESNDSSPQSIFSAQNSPDPCGEAQDCNQVPDSIREASSPSDLCTAEAKDGSSHPSTEVGKFDSENHTVEHFVDGEASFSNGANGVKGSEIEEVLAPALDLKEVEKVEKFVAEEIGARSCSRDEDTQLDASEKVRNGEDLVADDQLWASSHGRDAAQSDTSRTPAESSVGKKLSNGDVERESDHNVVKDRSGRIVIESRESEVSFRDEFLSSVSVEDQEGEGDDVAVAGGLQSGIEASSEVSTSILQYKETSRSSSQSQERVNGKDIQDVNSEIIPMSNEPDNKVVRETLIENQEKVIGKVQDEPSGTKEEICEEKLHHTENISSVEVVDCHDKEKLLRLAPEQYSGKDEKDEDMDDTNISSQTALASDPHGNRKEAVLLAGFTTDKNQCLPSPTANTAAEIVKLNSIEDAEVSMTDSKASDAAGDTASQKIMGANPNIILNGLQSMTSAKTLEGAEIVDVKLEVVDFPKVLPKSPTRGSSVCDGSVSSYEGSDYQNLHVDAENLGRISEVEDQVAAEGEMRDHFAATNHHQIKRSSSNNQAMPHSGMVSSPEDFEGARRDFRRNRMMRPRTEENLPPRYSVQHTNSEMAYESSVSSNLMHDEYQTHSNSYLPPQGYRDIETRAIRRHDMEGKTCSDYGWARDGGVPARQPYCGSACEAYPTRSYERYHQYPGVRSCELHYPSFGANYGHVPYPGGEAFRGGYQRFHRDPYLPSQPPPSELRWSSASQLSPPRGGYYSKDWNSVRSWKQPLDSYPASPQYVDSVDSYSWGGYDASTDEQRHRYEMVDNSRLLQVRKKQLAVQRHCRPMAGGAPFVTCYECSMLLQLPSDFLLFKSRSIHRLKCTCCSTVLKFQLEKGDHLVPYTPKARPPITREEAIENEFNNAGSTSREGNTKCQAVVVPERQSKVTWKKSLSKGKRVMLGSGEGASTSSSMDNTPPRKMKVSEEQQPGRSTSPLHRLMGYSSPSHVLYGSRSVNPDTP